MTTPESATAGRQRWIDAYTRHTTAVLSTLALVYLVTYSIQAIWHEPGAVWYQALADFGVALWVLFAIDLLLRFFMSTAKRHFFRRNLLDTITVVIPQFRALRALRAFTSGGVLSGKGLLSGGAVTSAILAVLLIAWVGGLMVLNAERGAPGAEITSLQDAIWWAFETITTVGYGDFVPVTTAGRIFAVLVMFAGIAVIGVVSASIAAALVKKGGESTAPTEVTNHEIVEELAQLKEMVARLEARLIPSQTPPSATAPESLTEA